MVDCNPFPPKEFSLQQDTFPLDSRVIYFSKIAQRKSIVETVACIMALSARLSCQIKILMSNQDLNGDVGPFCWQGSGKGMQCSNIHPCVNPVECCIHKTGVSLFTRLPEKNLISQQSHGTFRLWISDSKAKSSLLHL